MTDTAIQTTHQESYSQLSQGDEINLLDLFWVLIHRWKVIAAFIVLSVFGGVVYIVLTPPEYEVQAVVKAPENKFVQPLNIPRLKEVASIDTPGVGAPVISQISPPDIFATFATNLKSNSLREKMLVNKPFFPSSQVLRENLKILEGKKKIEDYVVVNLRGGDGKQMEEWLNSFLLLVDSQTIDEFVSGVEQGLLTRKKVIEDHLQIARNVAYQRRLDRIALLDEQIAIASAAKIYERNSAQYSTAESQRIGETVVITQEALYMRGVKELTAEKQELEKRKNDEPFIVGLRDKQEILEQLDAGLQQLQTARENAHAVHVDQPAILVQKEPVKPKRLLVLVVSVVLGAGIGMLVALVVNALQSLKGKNVGEKVQSAG